ncbi:MAG: hypothetical protein KI788_15810 [Mameliella sp.]|nr:hypothetical protein [Mameliella sp.]
MASETITLDDLQGARRELYGAARQAPGKLFTFFDEELGEQRRVRYSRPRSSGGSDMGLDDVLGHRTPGYWYDSPAEGGPGVRFEDGETT